MKKLSLILVLTMVIGLLAGCAGTPVIYYTECTCPANHVADAPAVNAPAVDAPVVDAPVVEGALKTGLCISASVKKSVAATADAAGKADYDVTMVAVLVDDNGVIQQCIIDGIAASVAIDAKGALPAELPQIQTKNELGDAYNMVAYGGAIAEWDAQAAALAAFAVGKTAEELRNGAIDETGYAPEGSDRASSATIYLGGYVAAIEAAAASAQHLGAQAGDELKLASVNSVGSSAAATAEKDGNAQLDSTVAALTVKDGVITSCVIDAVQAKVAFNTAGEITSDITAPVQTKTQLGDAYNMVAYGGAIAEWYEQAASFAAYVTGKTLDQVSGIAVDENNKPAEADLVTSVTIKIGDFQKLIEKAMQ